MTDQLPQAAQDVLAERQRQISEEGWTPEYDDAHASGDMALAASCYAAMTACNGFWRRLYSTGDTPPNWPWSRKWRKPTNDRRDLVKAGALIIAEIERLDRMEAQHDPQ